MIEFFGLVATALFLSGLFSQIKKNHARKMADDISLWTLGKWCAGLTIFLIISLQTKAHWVFPVGYGLQVIVCFYLFMQVAHYQKEMAIRMKRIEKNIMKEVKKLRVYDGGK